MLAATPRRSGRLAGHRSAARLLGVLAAALLSGDSPASTLWTYYDADEGPGAVAPHPLLWSPSLLSASNVRGVRNDLGSGHDAWEVRDDSRSNRNPTYLTRLSPTSSTSVAPDGWRLTSFSRVVDEYREGGATGLLAFFGNRRYDAALGLDPSGALVGEVRRQRPTGQHELLRFPLAPPGPQATAYHQIALEWRPGSQGVSFLFNGAEVFRWAGLPVAVDHPNLFEWGSVGVEQRGVMRFRSVRLELGPFAPSPAGDFDGDGVVGIADYEVWRASFAGGFTVAGQGADGNNDGRVDAADFTIWRDAYRRARAAAPTPEPTATSLLLLGAGLFATGARNR